MATLVGTQKDFASALRELIELDYDAIEAYKTAINRLESTQYKVKLQEFQKDHETHVEELSKILNKHNGDVPTGPSNKQWLTKGKVVLANIIGDEAILAAMKTNEEDTNAAYENMAKRDDQWEDVKGIIQKGLGDERRHKIWLESVIDEK